MKKTLILCAIVALFYSCSPKVITNVTSRYDSLPEDETIAVFGLSDRVPQKSQKLGTISIGDTGFSTNCGYDKVIYLAKTEARKAGGNALKITDHKEPNFWGSSCHRITADILRLSASSDAEMLAEADNGNTQAYYNEAGSKEWQENYSKFKISVGIGGGYRINKLADGLTSNQRDHMKKMKEGLNLELNGEYYVSEIFGIGVSSSWFRSAHSYLATEGMSSFDLDDKIQLFYVGPKFVIHRANNQGWFVEFSAGYLGYHQTLKAFDLSTKITGGCFGGVCGLGYDISITESVGIAFKLALTSGTLSKVTRTLPDGQKETIELSKDEKEGLSRISLTVGIQFRSK